MMTPQEHDAHLEERIIDDNWNVHGNNISWRIGEVSAELRFNRKRSPKGNQWVNGR